MNLGLALYKGSVALPLAGGGSTRIDPEHYAGLARWLAGMYNSNPYVYAAGLVVVLMVAGVVFNKLVDAFMYVLAGAEAADLTD